MRAPAPILLLLAGLASASQLLAWQDEPERPARDIGLIERAGTRLAQLDVTVIGSREAIESLRDEDLRVKIKLRAITDFRVDRLCVSDDPQRPPELVAPGSSQLGSPPAPPATYLLYFDQPHLTLAGRQNALDIAAELVRRLIDGDARAMIVSNADSLKVVEPLTTDPQLLLDGLNRLEKDRQQWDSYAQLEESRVADVIRVLNEENQVSQSIGMARRFHKEESVLTDRNMRRLRLTLGQLVDLDPPKALIYFGDSLRANAGEHYLSFFGSALRAENPILGVMQTSSEMGGLAFDSVINEASAQGIRVYAIEPQGIVKSSDAALISSRAMASTGSTATPSRIRERDSRETLASLAAETGGEVFLNGVPAARIAERVESDSSCLFLISFDPAGLPEDVALRAKVTTDRRDVELRVRGRIVLLSESARRTSSLLRAFGSPDSVEDPFEVRTGLVPTGFDNGAFSALLQLSVPAIPLHGSSWDLGATVISGQRIRDEGSGQVSISGPGVPVVFEREVRFRPGEYEIVAVAHERTSGLIASDRVAVTWREPAGASVVAGPIALLQPVNAAFSRDGSWRSSGSLVRAPNEPVYSDRPTALVGLVCRSRRHKGEISVRRQIVGETSVDFPPLTFDLEDDRCAQVRDVVPADNLRPGVYRYAMRVLSGGRRLHEIGREFVVISRRR